MSSSLITSFFKSSVSQKTTQKSTQHSKKDCICSTDQELSDHDSEEEVNTPKRKSLVVNLSSLLSPSITSNKFEKRRGEVVLCTDDGWGTQSPVGCITTSTDDVFIISDNISKSSCPTPSVSVSSKIRSKDSEKRSMSLFPKGNLLPVTSSRCDCAPFANLVHVQQQGAESAVCNHRIPVGTSRTNADSSLACNGISDWSQLRNEEPQDKNNATSIFKVISSSEHAHILSQLQTKYPHLLVSNIYERYSELTYSNSLVCSIPVLVGERRIRVSGREMIATKSEHMHTQLWTQVYQPKKSCDMVGNQRQCSELVDWLRQWKKTSRKSMKGSTKHTTQRKQKSLSTTVPSWLEQEPDCDFMSVKQLRQARKSRPVSSVQLDEESDEEQDLCHGMVICGPTGAGKSAAVYACAEELGLEVYEVNAGGVRSKTQLLSCLREVTQSHQVTCKQKPHPFLNKPAKPCIGLSANTVILLDEVDVLFPEDRGFWSAVYELLSSTKRPIVMTCTDVQLNLDCPHRKLVFSRPDQDELCVHIQVLLLLHGVQLSDQYLAYLLSILGRDFRKILLHLQTWFSWLPSNQSNKTVATDCLTTPSGCLATPWRSRGATNLIPQIVELDSCAVRCDTIGQLDIIGCSLGGDCRPWWRVTPTVSLLDELPTDASDVTMTISSDLQSRLPVVYNFKDEERRQLVHSLQLKASSVFSKLWTTTHIAMATEILPVLSGMCVSEDLRFSQHTKRRFCHYLKSCTVDLEELVLFSNTRF